jgi:hypothetical protein
MKSVKRIVFKKEPEKFIERVIAKFVQESPANRRKLAEGNTGKHLWLDSLQGKILFSGNIKRSSANSTLHLTRFLN